MTTDHTRPDPPDKAEQEVGLRRLYPLIGRWKLELSVPTNPPTVLRGLWSTFEWMEGGLFLVWRWGPSRSDFPGGAFPGALSIVGYDDSTEQYFMHYFDSRGVYRVCDMSLMNLVWKISRSSPGFSQRFTATLSDSGTDINGSWERSSDGTKWDHDFDMVFSKAT